MDWQTFDRKQKHYRQRSMTRRRKSVFLLLMIVSIWVYFVPIVQQSASNSGQPTQNNMLPE